MAKICAYRCYINKVFADHQSQQIMCWYRWQTNPTRLVHSGGSRGVLSIEEVLAGGKKTKGPRALKEVEVYSQMYYADNVKQSADEAIAKGNVTSRGSKLLVCREITAEKYEAESSTVKDKVRKKHKLLRKKFRKARKIAKAKIREEVDDETKMRYVPLVRMFTAKLTSGQGNP